MTTKPNCKKTQQTNENKKLKRRRKKQLKNTNKNNTNNIGYHKLMKNLPSVSGLRVDMWSSFGFSFPYVKRQWAIWLPRRPHPKIPTNSGSLDLSSCSILVVRLRLGFFSWFFNCLLKKIKWSIVLTAVTVLIFYDLVIHAPLTNCQLSFLQHHVYSWV